MNFGRDLVTFVVVVGIVRGLRHKKQYSTDYK